MVSVLQLGIFLTMSICLVGSTKINTTYYLFYAPERFSIEDGLDITVILFEKVENTTKVIAELKDGDKVIKTVSEDIPADKKIAILKMDAEGLEIKHYTLELNLGGKLKVFCGYGASSSIQTNKNTFKPDDLVKFRIINLYRNLTARNSPAAVKIKDANGNLLYEMQLTSNNGVSLGEFQISHRPVLGTWTLEVEQDGTATKKSFKVEKYVLPKVEVTARIPEKIYTLNKESLKGVILRVTVSAQYTQGKPVSGTAKLFINTYCFKKKNFSQPITKETTFKIDLGKETSGSCYSINIQASVENDLDKKVYHADFGRTYITSFPISIKQQHTSNMYEPNVMSSFLLPVKREDGLPLTDEDRKNPLNISLNIQGFSFNTVSKIPKSGIVEFAFTPPNRKRLPLKVVYNGVYQSQKYQNIQEIILVPVSEYGSFSLIRKDIESSKPEFYLSFPMEVTSFFYTVVSRSKVFISKHVNLSTRHTTISFDTKGMILKAHLVVGYSNKYGVLNTKSAIVDVKRSTSVSLNAKFKNSPLKPGQNAELEIQANPNSAAFVAVVDKSVLLLSKETNQISEIILPAKINNNRFERSECWNKVNDLCVIGIAAYTNLQATGPIVFDDGFVRKESMGEASGGNAPKPRTNFVETWIWDTVDTGSSGKASLVKTAPDTITTWVTTMFVIDPSEGFIPFKGDAELITFKDFYISLGIPYSVVRGERFNLNVYVFKYVSKSVMVKVQLMNSNKTVKKEKTIDMAANVTEVAEEFEMEPQVVGKIPVLVQASIPGHTDAVQRYLNVIAEGSVYEKSQPLSVNVSSKESYTKLVPITYPLKVVEGSEVVSVSVIGDIMGPVLSGLEKLIRFPTGCGEQTMLSLYPNVVVFMYLEARSQLDMSTKQKLEKYTIGGYQNELTYQHKDGSFSAFGERDESGSTWLTAYVVSCFCKIKHHMKGVTIDSAAIKKAVSWLLERQGSDGSFKEVGRVIHKDMQGGTSSGVTLTAFVAISLLQCEGLNLVNIDGALQKTTEYLQFWVDKNLSKDDYPNAVLLTAFALMKDDDYFNKVNKRSFSLATVKDTPPDASKSVETAAYILFAYSHKRKIEESVPFYNYLSSQRNSFGGFKSTQDTVRGLEALGKYAMLFSQKEDAAVDVKIKTDEGTEYAFPTVTKANELRLFKKDFPSSTKNLEVKVTGNGYVLVQVNWQYNLIPVKNDDNLYIKMNRKDTNLKTGRSYDACVEYTGNELTGMVLVSINTLSGYTANPVDPSSNSLIQKSEVDGNKLVVYMDSLPNGKETCFPVEMDYETKVDQRKPQTAEVAFYYQPDVRADTTYTAEGSMGSHNRLQPVCLGIMLLLTALFKLVM